MPVPVLRISEINDELVDDGLQFRGRGRVPPRVVIQEPLDRLPFRGISLWQSKLRFDSLTQYCTGLIWKI